jgi:hypothetical protein
LKWAGEKNVMLESHPTNIRCEEGVHKCILFAKHGEKPLKLEIYEVTIDTLSEANSSLKLLHTLSANDIYVWQLTRFQIIASPNYLFFWKVTKEGREAKIEM